MAQPNIVNVSNIKAETRGRNLTTSTTDALLANAASSGTVYKINALMVANVDGTNAATLDVKIVRGTTNAGTYFIVKALTIGAGVTADILSRPIYLEEDDTLVATASAASDLDAIVSYEAITDA